MTEPSKMVIKVEQSDNPDTQGDDSLSQQAGGIRPSTRSSRKQSLIPKAEITAEIDDVDEGSSTDSNSQPRRKRVSIQSKRRRKNRSLPLNMPSKEAYLERRRKAERKRSAARRATMTPEQKEAERLKAKLRARQIRQLPKERAKQEQSRKEWRQKVAARRAAMTPEEKEAVRLKERLKMREKRLSRAVTEFPLVQEKEDQCMLYFIKGQIRNRIRTALETPASREIRLAKDREDRKKTGRKRWYNYSESPEERALREMLVREAFAVEIGDDREIKQFEEFRNIKIQSLNALKSKSSNTSSKSKSSVPKHLSKVDKEVLSFWDHKNSDWDGIISDDGSEACEDSDDEGMNDSEETLGEWSVRVSDIFNSRNQGKSKTNLQPQEKRLTVHESHKSNAPIKDSTSIEETPENANINLDFCWWDKQDLINVVSAEKAERVLIVQAEIAERRAALAGETEEELKARVRLMIDDAQKIRDKASMAFAKRNNKGRSTNDNVSFVDDAAVQTTNVLIDPVSNDQTATKDTKTEKERLAEYMRRRYDLLKVEWETWVGLRDASAPHRSSQITSEVTGAVNAQVALNWLEENMEDHRWGITTGASVKMGKTVPEAVKKYRLSLATLIDKDEKRSGPNARRVAKETLLALLTTERKILEEYFYGRRNSLQKYYMNSRKKLNPESLAERKARINERLREKYKAKRISEGKTYDPERASKANSIKDKETLLKEIRGEIPRSTRGITKTRSDKPRGKALKPVVRNGRVLHISKLKSTKLPTEEDKSIEKGNTENFSASSASPAKEFTLTTNALTQKPLCTVVSCSTSTTSAPEKTSEQPQTQTSRSKRKNKRKEETPLPEEHDSNSDWTPADVDESLFDDDDSRGRTDSITPPQEAWNSPPALEAFSTIHQSHLYSHSIYSQASYSTAQAYTNPINVGHGILLGNPVPTFPTAVPQQNPTHYQSISNVYSEVTIPVSPSGRECTTSYTSSEDSGPPTLSSEENSSSIPDSPPQKKRKGRPTLSLKAKKVRKNCYKWTSTKIDRTEKKSLNIALLRPDVIFTEGKVPTVAHPGLLIEPSDNLKSSNNAEPETAVTKPAVAVTSLGETFKCSECSEEFKDSEKLTCHKVDKHPDTKTEPKCAEKNSDLKSTEKIKPKKKRKNDSITFQCPLCEMVLNHQQGTNVFTNHLWTVHWKDERNTDLGPCPICLRTLKGQGSRFFFYLSRHVRNHHTDILKQTFIPGVKAAEERNKEAYQKFYCVLCPKNFPTYLSLADHIDNGHSRACHVCGIILQVQDHLKDHVQIFHPLESYIPQEILSEEKLKGQVHCDRCHSKFIGTDHLKSHEESCEGKTIRSYKCWWNCLKSGTFTSLDALENHHKKHHKTDTIVPNEGYDNLHHLYKCELCIQRCSTLPYLRLHYIRAHPSGPPLPEVDISELEIAPNTRPQLHTDSLKSVQKTTTTEKQTETKTDEIQELTKTNPGHAILLQSQPAFELNAPAYTCGECSKGFTAHEFCRLHRGYRKARRRCCRICGAQYSHIESLIGHNRTKHGISAEENTRFEKEYDEQRLQAAREKEESILKCAVCLMSFVAKDFHIMHSTMGDMLDPDMRSCPHCPTLSFCRKRDLDKHMALLHSDSKTAAEATRRLEKEKEVKRERQRAKTQEVTGQDWTCDQCGAIFTLKQSLQRHKRNVHMGMQKRFQCPHCEQQCSRIEQLRNHIKSIHGPGGSKRLFVPNKPRPVRVHIPDKQCPRCIRKFATERALQIHIDKVHGQETLCYACGETIKDIKAHNNVCPMGGMEEDAIKPIITDQEGHTTPKRCSKNPQMIAKLSLLGLLKIIRSHKEECSQKVPVGGAESTRKKDKLKPKPKRTRLSEDVETESESEGEESDNQPLISKTFNLRKTARKKMTTDSARNSCRRKKKQNKTRTESPHKNTKAKKSFCSNSPQKTITPNLPKVERPRRRRKIDLKLSDPDEFANDVVNKDADDEELFEEIIIKEEVCSFEEEDFYVEDDLDDDFEIKPDTETCSIENCMCERGKWADIFHSDKLMTVQLVRCDPEVQAIDERRKQEKAENERKMKQSGAKRELKRKSDLGSETKRKKPQAKKSRRKTGVKVVDPLEIAHSMSSTPRVRSGLETPATSRSFTRGWTQLHHIAESITTTKDSDSSEYDDEDNDPPYDPLAL